MTKTRSDWTYGITEILYATGKVEVVTIIDKDLGNRSVTNDIENVLESLQGQLPKPLTDYPITYIDSDDAQDEIVIGSNGRFLAFAPLPRGRSMRYMQAEAVTRWEQRRRNS